MASYFIGTIFIALYIVFMYLIGISITKNKKSYTYSFLLGYAIFSVVVAMGGIPIQLLNLSWKTFLIYLILVFLILSIIIVYSFYKNSLKVEIKDFVSSQYFFIVVSFFLVFISVFKISDIWMCNCLDDGYYISLVGGQPGTVNGFNTNPSTGFAVTSLGTYILNTIYTEYSIYANLLHINPIVLCRVFMSFFNYFLLGCFISYFAEIIFKNKIKNTQYQYFSIIMLLFGLPYTYLINNHILEVQDSWQFNTAMFYGSSIVRTSGMFFLLFPFIDKNDIKIKDVLFVIALSIGLVSKSTIAIPVIFVSCISYLLVTWILKNEKKYYLLSAVLVLFLYLIGVLLAGKPDIQNIMWQQLFNNLTVKSIFVYSCLLFLVASFFGNRSIIRINLIVLLSFVFMYVDPINNIFEELSVYQFVSCRMLTMMIYFIIIMSFIYIIYACLYLFRFIEKKYKHGLYRLQNNLKIVLIIVAFVFSSLVMFQVHDMHFNASVVYRNKMLIPDSTIYLANALEERYKETNEINYVMMPEGVFVNNNLHSVAIILRSLAPHTVNFSAASRYGEPTMEPLKGYSAEIQKDYDKFVVTPNNETYEPLHKTFEKYPINCFITVQDAYREYLQRDGFQFYKVVSDSQSGLNYFMYTRS